MRRVLHLMRKELLELRQDPRLFGVVILAPVLQLTILGYAASTDVRDIPVVIVDADRSSQSRELIHRFEASSNFKIVGLVGSTGEIDQWLDRGDAWMALSIPADYGRTLVKGRPATVQVVADGTDANSTTVAMSYTINLIGAYSQDLMAATGPLGAARSQLVSPEVRVWFNPRLESRDFMVPGIVALLLL
ncbi:MAG: ABC transporter permease, partial [Vicinamibacterales bacterium]